MVSNSLRIFCTFLLLTFVLTFPLSGVAQQAEGGYLNYQEPPAPSETSSWVSTLAYVLSLIATFAAVLGFAYFTSRLLGQKLGNLSTGPSSKILTTLPLGNNRGVYVVEVAGKFLVLGVTDHGITLLQEIVDEAEIERIRRQKTDNPQQEEFQHIFQKQLASLQQLSQKIPAVFEQKGRNKQDDGQEKG
ncbi:flagellar biosynthetic protein FliO|uniref:Flagellar protein n=1 Tax=Dendrosporobacter quercicolus TaxID=146817 RepID=A0A1G9MIE4_9FIRM|nr:flagellar biosynthetic protein FliO [Dendrosporobacter quercicolus]NSL47049.1 flagellar biosynthetic protein FliO [Dendrosporobacter quercicolus DSM 1736]SDL74038.1 flagellar protein FliO/FliZ [Dendrosporobacter quercicolus]